MTFIVSGIVLIFYGLINSVFHFLVSKETMSPAQWGATTIFVGFVLLVIGAVFLP